ncbi:hypothetical protein [Mesorhizobium sp. GbtcB19]|uniref:hypothetical protein n=1 Tax=Mesorhizobium sp. GbtcB19 TaxID=2824764 RepID=UPI001C30586D|nr:hypothetical protein [Mesorhizobium sp. GbtcB19]
MNEVPLTRLFTEGEQLAFPRVGQRRYVRGLDVAALVERRCPDFARLGLKFLRPIANRAVISFKRGPATAVAVSLTPRHGASVDLYVANLEDALPRAESEPALAAHVALPGGAGYHRYLVLGRHGHSEILAVVFNRYQAATGRRFLLRTLHLERRPAATIELVSLKDPRTERGLTACSITRQGRPWCRIEMIDAEG